jgi:hypothetical protein
VIKDRVKGKPAKDKDEGSIRVSGVLADGFGNEERVKDSSKTTKRHSKKLSRL